MSLPLQVEAYVISTNTDLDMSRGVLSRQLLQLVGPKLQEECNEYAPLPVGQVAVTAAHGVCCDFILHVALPMYKSKGSERVSFTTPTTLMSYVRPIYSIRPFHVHCDL